MLVFQVWYEYDSSSPTPHDYASGLTPTILGLTTKSTHLSKSMPLLNPKSIWLKIRYGLFNEWPEVTTELTKANCTTCEAEASPALLWLLGLLCIGVCRFVNY